MEIYKFFYPHFNPLLSGTPLRQQELSELSQSTALLRRAIEQAEKRNAPSGLRVINHDQLQSALKALKYAEATLENLEQAHPGDSLSTLEAVARERTDMPGWRSWASLFFEQLRYAYKQRDKAANE